MPLPHRRPAPPPWADVVLAGALLAVSLTQVLVAPIAGPAVSVLVAVGSTVPVAWRRRYPATVALLQTAVWLVPTPEGFLLVGYVVAVLVFYSAGTSVVPGWRLAAVTVPAVAVGVVVTLLGPEPAPTAIGAALVVLGPVAAGRLVAHQRAQTARLAELTEELVRERAAAERAAAAEERTRIARELHDVIGHEVSLIALQADAAAAALAQAPERAAAPVATIRAAAADALAEMRRVVGLLRTPGEDDGDGLRPQPGLADLPALAARSRAAGVDVRLDAPPAATPVPVPQSVQLAAYRVVQEALTNAARHSPGSAVHVRVTAGGGDLCVEVRDTGSRRAPAAPGGGHGLAGMRERVRLLGGDLHAGPEDAGFAVTARLPLAAGAPR
ncbi:sensor histidine kinase [Blastococcus sp. URHD0036]|uniref:sensor histidine kinase n=1 Tax=Blastococcus sp. URHD0036 TaxID=1380356 RepID=UPI00068E063C|nr:histidine kinase [Blastococcus sp. URHD0036]